MLINIDIVRNTNNISLIQEDRNITIYSCDSPMSPNLCKSHRNN